MDDGDGEKCGAARSEGDTATESSATNASWAAFNETEDCADACAERGGGGSSGVDSDKGAAATKASMFTKDCDGHAAAAATCAWPVRLLGVSRIAKRGACGGAADKASVATELVNFVFLRGRTVAGEANGGAWKAS